MTDLDLIRFLDAQAPIYARVVEELTKGRKRTHWMWSFFRKSRASGEVQWRSTTLYVI